MRTVCRALLCTLVLAAALMMHTPGALAFQSVHPAGTRHDARVQSHVDRAIAEPSTTDTAAAGAPSVDDPRTSLGQDGDPSEPSVLESWVARASVGPLNPLNVLAVLTALAIGLTCWQAWTARPRIENAREIPTTTAPGTLHPAYAGAIASGHVGDVQIEAAVLELAHRGALVIEPDTEARGKVQVRLLDTSRAETGFEARLLERLRTQGTNGVLDHKTLSKTRRQWSDICKILQRDLEDRGWFDPGVNRLRSPFIVAGAIGILLAGALFAASIVAQEPWTLIGVTVAGTAGILAVGLGSIFPSTTREGELQAIPWRGYRTGLIKARDSHYGEVDLDRAFPYIVAMGLAPKYQRHLRRARDAGYVPEWLGSQGESKHYAGNWYVYWIALHTSMAPTDASTTSVFGAVTGSCPAGGRFWM